MVYFYTSTNIQDMCMNVATITVAHRVHLHQGSPCTQGSPTPWRLPPRHPLWHPLLPALAGRMQYPIEGGTGQGRAEQGRAGWS